MADPQTQNSDFNLEGARKAGYSDDEIIQHLAQARKFDYQGALKAGYSKDEILSHLTGGFSNPNNVAATFGTPGKPFGTTPFELLPSLNSGKDFESVKNELQNNPQFRALANTLKNKPLPQKPPGFVKRAVDALAVPKSLGEIPDIFIPGASDMKKAAEEAGKAIGQKNYSGAALALVPPPIQNAIDQFTTHGKEAVKLGEQVGKGEVPLGEGLGAVGSHALEASLNSFPFFGPAIETAGEDIAHHNYSGAAGGLTSIIGQLALPKIAEKVAPKLPGRSPAAQVASQEKAFNVIHPENAVGESVLPEVRSAAASEVAQGKPIPYGDGRVINRALVQRMPKIIQTAIEQHEQAVHQVADPFAGETVDMRPAAQAALQQITPELIDAAQKNPNGTEARTIQAIQDIAQQNNGEMTMQDAFDRKHRYNDTLHAELSKPLASQDVSPLATQALRNAANALRDAYYKRLGELSGQDVRPLAQKEGQLIEAKAGATKTGEAALKGKANDTGTHPIATQLTRAASRISLTKPATWVKALPDAIRAILDPEGQTPTGQYAKRVTRALSNLPAPTTPQPSPYPGGRLPVQQPLPTVNGPLFSLEQTPYTLPSSSPAAMVEPSLLEPGQGAAPSAANGHEIGQPVAALHPETGDKLTIGRGMVNSPADLFTADNNPYGTKQTPRVGEEHPEIEAQLPKALADAVGLTKGAERTEVPSSPVNHFVPPAGEQSVVKTSKGATLTPISERPRKSILSLKTSKGERLGQISLSPVDDLQKGAVEISTSQISPEAQGKGYGTDMYRRVIEYARKKGATAIYSDDQTSPQAKRVWKTLSQEYKVTREGGRFKIDLNQPKSTTPPPVSGGSPSSEVKGKPAPVGTMTPPERFKDFYDRFKAANGREPNAEEMQRLIHAGVSFDAIVKKEGSTPKVNAAQEQRLENTRTRLNSPSLSGDERYKLSKETANKGKGKK